MEGIGKFFSNIVATDEQVKPVEYKGLDDVRVTKFETMIEDINKAIKRKTDNKIFRYGLIPIQKTTENVALALIFDYRSCNKYAKRIIRKSELVLISQEPLKNEWAERYPDEVSLRAERARIEAAKFFVKYCSEPENVSEGYKFIFWALMILTVDKTNADEYLSLICDFANMLKISDEEFEDIIYTVKVIYGAVDGEYTFKSRTIPDVLGGIFRLYGYELS